MALGRDLEREKVLIHVESCDDASDNKESRTIQRHMIETARDCTDRRRKSDVVRQPSVSLLNPCKLKTKSRSIEREVDIERSISIKIRAQSTANDKNRQIFSKEDIGK